MKVLPFQLATALMALSLLIIPVASADQVVMKNGDRLTGKVVKAEEGKLVFKTPYAGEISISLSKVARIETEADVTVVLEDNSELVGRLVTDAAGVPAVKVGEDELPEPLETQEIFYINPPPELFGLGIRTEGRTNLGIIVQRGNTDKDQFRLDGEVTVRGRENRFRAYGEFNNEKNEGLTTVSNATLLGEFNRFFTKKLFFSAGLLFEHDEFQDVRLRTTPSAGIGYQFFEGERRNLSLQGGLAWVDERRFDDDNVSYAALSEQFNYDEYFLNKLFQLFHTHNTRYSLTEDAGVIFSSRQGFRFPLPGGFNATLEYDYDINTKPAEDAEKTDTKFLATVGYGW